MTGDAINPTRKTYDELDAAYAHFSTVICLAGSQYDCDMVLEVKDGRLVAPISQEKEP